MLEATKPRLRNAASLTAPTNLSRDVERPPLLLLHWRAPLPLLSLLLALCVTADRALHAPAAAVPAVPVPRAGKP